MLLFVACCSLSVVGCSLFNVRCLLFVVSVVCCWLCVVTYRLVVRFAICCLMFDV